MLLTLLLILLSILMLLLMFRYPQSRKRAWGLSDLFGWFLLVVIILGLANAL